MRSRPRLWAHRGAAAEQPENTMPSFQRALDLGADALEMDLHMTADGHVVVSHDPSGMRMTGVNAEIRRCRWQEVRTWDAGVGFVDVEHGRPFAGREYRIPLFEEVLAEFPHIPINVDVKQWDPPMAAQVIRLIGRMGAEDRVIIASFRLRTLLHIRGLRYQGQTALSQPEVVALVFAPEFALTRLPIGSAAQIPTKAGPVVLANPTVIDKCHKLGIRVDFWTINEADEAERLLAMGADGIMTDDPAKIAPVFARL